MELTAFAHMARRDVKVIQPGLVYVIDWSAGWDISQLPSEPWISSNPFQSMKREQGMIGGRVIESESDDEHKGPVYVACVIHGLFVSRDRY